MCWLICHLRSNSYVRQCVYAGYMLTVWGMWISRCCGNGCVSASISWLTAFPHEWPKLQMRGFFSEHTTDILFLPVQTGLLNCSAAFSDAGKKTTLFNWCAKSKYSIKSQKGRSCPGPCGIMCFLNFFRIIHVDSKNSCTDFFLIWRVRDN